MVASLNYGHMAAIVVAIRLYGVMKPFYGVIGESMVR